MWAWTFGVVNTSDRDAWKLVRHETFRFYQTHGMERLATLKQHVIDASVDDPHINFLKQHYDGSPCRVGSVKRSVLASEYRLWKPRWHVELSVSRACQLRMLYCLFGRGPTTWEEAVAVKGVDEELGTSSGRSVIPIPLIGWAYGCDYP